MNEYKAKTVELAIENGLNDMNLTRENAEINIISEGGFLKKAIVQISAKITDFKQEKEQISTEETTVKVEEKVEKTDEKDEVNLDKAKKPYHENDLPVINFLTEVLDKMGLNCTLDIKSNKDVLTITIKGEDSNYAIGYRGETLDNLQFLCLLVANKNTRFKKKLILDAEGYRELRTKTLTSLSKKLAIKVSKTNTAIELEPMNPFERRVIHTALQDDPYVTTTSEGEEPNRYVVISPVKKEVNMYDNSISNNFKKSGIKTRSFGQKQRRF